VWVFGQCYAGLLNSIKKFVRIVWVVLRDMPPDFFKVVFGFWAF
jgi:hypothetical protein